MSLLLQMLLRSNPYTRNLPKFILMGLWQDTDSSAIILPVDLDLFGTHEIFSVYFFFLTFAWFQVICGISNFPIVLLSLFSRAQTAKDANLNCRKSWPFML